jgi:hypothetical protein
MGADGGDLHIGAAACSQAMLCMCILQQYAAQGSDLANVYY